MSKTNTALVSDSDQSSDDEPLRPKPRESLSGLGQPPSSKQSSSNKSESATPSIANSPSKSNQKQRQRESSSMSNTSNKPKKRRKRLFSNRSDSRRKKNKLNIQEQEDEVELYHPYMDPEPGTEEDSDGSQASWNKEDAEGWQKYRLERKDQDTDGVFEVEDILRWRLHPRTRKVQYRTTWAGYSIYAAEWLLESQFDDKSLIKAFWKAHGGRPASLPKLESSVENHQLDPSDTDEAAYKHPISKAKRARKKIRTEVRRDKKIVRQKKAQVESKKEQGSVSSASSLVEPETRNGKGIENGSESQLQDTSTEKTACLSSSADDDSDDIPLQPQRKRQRTQSQKTSSNLPQFTKKKQNASVETATSYPAATVSDSEEEWVPRPEAKQQRNISQQKGRVQAEVSDSDSDSDDMWKPPDQQALKEKPSTTRGASTSSTASPEKALDQGQLKQPPHSVSWKGAHKRDPRVKLDDPVGPKASSSKYGIATSQPSLSSTASISKASLLPSEPSENNTKFLTNGIGLSASPTHLSASTPSPIGNKFASSKSSGQVNLHPTQASSTYKIPLQEKLGISGTALEVITSGLHDHFVIGPVGGDDTLAALLEVSKCSSLGASNLAKELGRPSAIWIEYQTRYILERGWLPEREMSEIKRKAIGECLHSAKLRYSAQFFLYGNFPSGQLFQATSAFPKQGGGIVTFTLAGLLHYAIHSNQAFMELAEVFHFGQLQELPPGMVRGFRLWSLKEELPPSWEVVIHPWIIAFLEDFLGKGQLAQVIEKFGIVGQGGASRPPGLIDEMIDNLPEFARKLDWDETCSQDAHAPAADSMLQVFAALDQEVISTMHKLQRLTMREKRFHIILTPDGSLVKGHHKGTEFGGVGIMEIEGLRRLAADQSQW